MIGGALAVPAVMQVLVPPALTVAWMRATARLSALLIRSVGLPCTLSGGNRLVLTNHVFRIDAMCTGGQWLVMFAFLVAIMPLPVRRKLQGLAVGLPVLLAFNFLRLVLVAAVSQEWPARLVFVHDVVMQTAYLLATVAVWAVWLWSARRDWKPGWDF